MHLPGARDLEPLALARSAGEHHVDLGRRLGEREVRRPEAHVELVGLEEAAQEVGVDALQVGEADVLVDPQALDLVEHRRVGRVAVDAVGAPERDHLDRRRVHARVAHLHRAGVRAQQQRLAVRVLRVDVERVLHRARRMVLGVVQRGEVVPVVLDLRTVGDVEADRAEDLLDALPGAGDRDGCRRAPRRRPGSVTSIASAARRAAQLRVGQRLRAASASAARCASLAALMRAPCSPLLLGRELAEALQALGDRARLAEEARLLVFERRGLRHRGECGAGFGHQLIEV